MSAVLTVIEGMASFKFCCGNEDEKYFSVQASRKGLFKDSTGKVFGSLCCVNVHNYCSGSNITARYVKDYFSFHTIRCASCTLLVPPSISRCDPCMAYRKILNVMVSRSTKASDSKTQPDSHVNLRFLNTPQRKERFSRIRVQRKVCQQHVKRLRERIERLIEENGVQVSSELNEDLVATMDEVTPEIIEKYPPDSFRWLFWEQQQRAGSLKNSRSMKWEPAMIR